MPKLLENISVYLSVSRLKFLTIFLLLHAGTSRAEDPKGFKNVWVENPDLTVTISTASRNPLTVISAEKMPETAGTLQKRKLATSTPFNIVVKGPVQIPTVAFDVDTPSFAKSQVVALGYQTSTSISWTYEIFLQRGIETKWENGNRSGKYVSMDQFLVSLTDSELQELIRNIEKLRQGEQKTIISPSGLYISLIANLVTFRKYDFLPPDWGQPNIITYAENGDIYHVRFEYQGLDYDKLLHSLKCVAVLTQEGRCE